MKTRFTPTPGPWRSVDDNRPKTHTKRVSTVRDARGKILAVLDFDTTGLRGVRGDFSHFADCGEAMDNARLMAAAPQMAEALARILTLIEGGADDEDLECVGEECRAALAKAWGCDIDEVTTADIEEIRADAS